MAVLKVGAVELPCPTSLSSSDEIIWSSNTGRTSSGINFRLRKIQFSINDSRISRFDRSVCQCFL